MVKDPKERTKKCNREIQIILNKYKCGIIATSTIEVDPDGYLKAIGEAKIVPLKPIKPPEEDGKTRYIN